MVHSSVHLGSVLLVVTASTVAAVFALLSWRIFRDSPFGTAIALLTLGMAALALYHMLLFATDIDPFILHVFRSATNTILAVFLGLLVIRHRQLRRDRTPGDGKWAD